MTPLLLLFAATAPAVDFAREVKPILESACVSCHGPNKRKAELRLDSRAAAVTGGITGPAFVPGKSGDSLLLKRVLGEGGDDRMPLKADPLRPEQIALLRRWIDAGAPWPEEAAASAAAADGSTHWAYRKPVRPTPPAVKNRTWLRNPIDAFVLARLEKEGLTPAPEAARESLLRRLTLDLTGLPPTLAEVDAFVRDRRPGAHERAVERLLASPHHGERWARPWLDLARYGDSHGYEKDSLRVAWKWRDWVVDALNGNMSFRQFTIEQLAGDMLPDAKLTQRIATGFHRNTLLNQEGGVDDEEARWETLVDRVNTTTTTWLGSTLGCAQCHNHKYDPFAQKDFYRFLAFFDNGQYRIHGSPPESYVLEPEIELPTPEQKAKKEALLAEIAAAEARLQPAENDEGRRAWEVRVRAAERAWRTIAVERAVSKGGATLAVRPDGSVLASAKNPEADAYELGASLGAVAATGIRLEVLGDPSLPAGGPGRARDGNFFLTGFTVEADGEPVKLVQAVSDEDIGGRKAESLLREHGERGWAVDVERKAVTRRQAVFVPDKPFGGKLVVRLEHDMPRTTRNLGRFRLSFTTAPDPTLIAVVPTRLQPALARPDAQRTAAERDDLGRLYVRLAEDLKPLHEKVASLKKAIDDLKIPVALVLEDRPSFERPSTHLRVRGSFTAVGEQVWAATPRVLGALPDSEPPNRLGLARWLVSDDNPLTARVTVNRIWAEYFGRGIVETTEDFGTQGSPPTHPELLDWLATELVRSGWDMKALHRLIVGSATYRQASRASKALIEKDPYNRLYARGPRFRLDAEAIRDVSLAASGLLSPRMGGPGVYPPQPEGIWDQPYSGLKWTPSEGDDRHRRAIYTILRRTSPYPSMVAFDAPSREVCTARRVRTNTPLQALVTLNDPAFFEAAQALARRMMKEAPADPAARATHGFRLCTARRPTKEELAPIVAYFQSERARGSSDVEAWTMVANVLLNLDETITKE